MKYFTSLIIALLFAPTIIFSQIDSSKHQENSYKLSGFFMGFMTIGINGGNISANMSAYLPHSTLLPNDLEGYSSQHWLSGHSNKNYAGFSFENKNTRIEGSIGYFTSSFQLASLYKETLAHSDTFSSNAGGVIIENIYDNESYTLEKNISGITLSSAFLYQPSLKRPRFKAYFGLGIEAMIGINNIETITKNSHTHSNFIAETQNQLSVSPYSNNYWDGEYLHEDVQTNLVQNNIYRVYIPLGLDFQLSKKENLFKHLLLGVRIEPGIGLNSGQVFPATATGFTLTYRL